MRAAYVIGVFAFVAAVMAMPYISDEESIVPESELLTGAGDAASLQAIAGEESKEASAEEAPSDEEVAEAKVAAVAKVAQSIAAKKIIVKNDLTELQDAVKSSTGLAKKASVDTLKRAKMALAKCKALKTKIYEDCVAAECKYKQKCGSKKAGAVCLKDQHEYHAEKKLHELRFKAAERAVLAKESKHKAWVTGAAERDEKKAEKKKRWDDAAPWREKGDKNFERIMGISKVKMHEKHVREIKEENAKADIKANAAHEAEAAQDKADMAKYKADKERGLVHNEQPSAPADLLAQSDWSDVLIEKFTATRRLLSTDDKVLDATAEHAKADRTEAASEAVTEAAAEQTKADEARAHSKECIKEEETATASCAALTKYADGSCEEQLKAAEGKFDHWLNPTTGTSVAGEKAKAELQHDKAVGIPIPSLDFHKRAVVAAPATTKTEQAEDKAGSALEKSQAATAAGNNAAATQAAEDALDSAAKAAEATATEAAAPAKAAANIAAQPVTAEAKAEAGGASVGAAQEASGDSA